MNNRFSRLLQFFGITLDFLSLNAVYFITRYLMQDGIVSDTTEYSYFWLWINTSWLLTSWISHLYSENIMGSFEMFSRRTMHTYFYWLLLIMMYLFFTWKKRLLSAIPCWLSWPAVPALLAVTVKSDSQPRTVGLSFSPLHSLA